MMAADGNWCTPPDSPSKARHGMISSSYEHAISDNDWYWDWHHDTREEDECDESTSGELESNKHNLSSSLPARSPPIPTPPREHVHDQPPPHLRSSDPIHKISISQQDSGVGGLGAGAAKVIDDFPNVTGKSVLVAASNPTTVGFTPAYQPSSSYETTQIASLPGSRRAKSVGDTVVLLPPKSNSKAPKSIEDVGNQLSHYAPVEPLKLDKHQIGHEEYDVGCFNYLTPFGEANLKAQEDAEISVSSLVGYPCLRVCKFFCFGLLVNQR